MISSKHNIDTLLVNTFISENNFDESINNSLLEWYGALDEREHQSTRDKAIQFLSLLSYEALSVIDYPADERRNLIGIFEPLERLLRTANSLKDFGHDDPENIRDHLSHTVRMVLFTNYLLFQYKLGDKSKIIRQLFIVAIYHDIAYPLEKLKRVAKKLGDATFKQLLNSSGKIDIELNNPDDLLEMLNYFGEIVSRLEAKRTSLDKTKNKKNTKTNFHNTEDEISRLDISIYKIKHIYTEIISPAIAGQGLFDSSHSISSVVLFLMPIIKHWKGSDTYQALNFDTIIDICLAMAYHDRKNDPYKLKCKSPKILGIMRICDELQEWGREDDAYVKDVIIEKDQATIISIRMIMGDRNRNDTCKPEVAISNKIKGILPVLSDGIIKVKFQFPRCFKDKKCLKKEIEEKGTKSSQFSISGNYESNDIELVFKDLKAHINFN
jgi:hypothetical protein